MSEIESEYQYYIGIDVGKYKLDIYNTITSEHIIIKNKQEDIEEYINQLKQSCIDNNKLINSDKLLIIIDLTGGYEKLISNVFYNSGFTSIIMAEGFKVKNFTKSIRHNRAKTDKIDCQILIEYGKYFVNTSDKSIQFYSPNAEDKQILEQLYNRIEDMKQTIQREKNRLKQPNLLPVMKISIEKQIDFLIDEINLLKETMKNIIENNKELKTIYDTLTNQKGIKDEISLFLIVKLKELGKIQRKQLSSICGLAPIPFDSGSSVKGHRYTRGGRKDIKSKLYFCVLSMIRYNTQFKNKLDDFVKRGKNKKIALVALARKLITQLNAIVRNALIREKLI
jgi:transposase